MRLGQRAMSTLSDPAVSSPSKNFVWQFPKVRYRGTGSEHKPNSVWSLETSALGDDRNTALSELEQSREGPISLKRFQLESLGNSVGWFGLLFGDRSSPSRGKALPSLPLPVSSCRT